MRIEESFGIVPFRQSKNGWEVFLVQLHAGHWGFPKGHGEPEESPLDTAKRELFEETHLTVDRLITDKTFEEKYTFTRSGQLTEKIVIYYLAHVSGNFKIQKEEVAAANWFPLDQVEQRLTFSNQKSLWKDIQAFISF